MQKKARMTNWRLCFGVLVFGIVVCQPFKAQQSNTDSETGSITPPCSNESSEKRAQRRLPFALLECTPMSGIKPEYYAEIARKYKAQRTEDLRNKLIFMAVAQIDLEFKGYERKRRHRNNLFQTVLSILEVGAATAISITNGERAKTIIADGLGFIQGSRDSINKNYRILERQILVNKMIERRAKILTEIYKKIDMPDEQYPFERAYIDILDYFEAGTMDSALNALAEDSGTNANNARNLLREEKEKPLIIRAPTSDQIRISAENTRSVQGIINRESAARGQFETAEKEFTEAKDKLAVERAKNPQVPQTIAEAEANSNKAEAKRNALQAEQKIEMEKLKTIFTAIENDSVLTPILDDLPRKFPNLGIAESLEKIRAEKGEPRDYHSVILRFYRSIVDQVLENPTAVQRAKNILESVR